MSIHPQIGILKEISIILVGEYEEPLGAVPFPLMISREVWNEITPPRQRVAAQTVLIPGKGTSLAPHHRLKIRRAHLRLSYSGSFQSKDMLCTKAVFLLPRYHVLFQLILERKHVLEWQETRFTKTNRRQSELFPNLHCSPEVTSLHIIYQPLCY